MGAMVRYSPFDPIDDDARAQIRLSYHEISGELPRVSTWLDITERVDDQAWTQIWHCATRTAGENFAQLGVRLTTPSGRGTGTLYVDNVGFWEISECPTDLDALSPMSLVATMSQSTRRQRPHPFSMAISVVKPITSMPALGTTGLMDCAEGEEANYPPNAKPNLREQRTRGHLLLQFTMRPRIHRSRYALQYLRKPRIKPRHGHCLGRNLSAWLLEL